MNQQTVRNAMIEALVHLDGNGDLFSRVLGELKRIDKTMPNATGKEKLAKFEADAVIIFDDLVLPIGGYILNSLIDLGLLYLRGTNPLAAIMASQIAPQIESSISSITKPI